MTALSINLNKIALIRNSRDTAYPSVVDFAHRVLAAGAHGITVHPRPDQRHIRASDCAELKAALPSDVELNIEGNPFAGPQKSQRSDVSDYPGFMAIIERDRPAQVTLVPDGDDQLTSDHGFDLEKDAEKIQPVIEQCHALGARVSLFMDPIPQQIRLAKEIGADRIELYTGPYAEDPRAQLPLFVAAGECAKDIGLGLNAGHDLNLENLLDFQRNVPDLLEVSIGHAFTVDALILGLEACIKAYLNCLAPFHAQQ